MFKEYGEDYQPSWEEMQEIENLLNQEARQEEMVEKIERNRIFTHFNGLESFKAWLKDNGIRWD
jgi:hypothetical protein